jgi:hypothetical protein
VVEIEPAQRGMSAHARLRDEASAADQICQNQRLRKPVRRSFPFPIARSSGVLARDELRRRTVSRRA